MISMNDELNEFAKRLSWREILEPVGFRETREELRSGVMASIWQYDDDEVSLTLFTADDENFASIMDNDHKGNRVLTKLDAIRRFRCNGNWQWAKALILEGIDIGRNRIDRIARKFWADNQAADANESFEERYIIDPLFQAIVDDEVGKLVSKEMAKQKFESLKFAKECKPTPPISLKSLLRMTQDENPYIIEDLLIVGGKAFFAAKAKSGKTTVSLALVKSLVTGEDFLGRFKVRSSTGPIGYLNMELTAPQMQRWCQRLDVPESSQVYFWNLRGKANPFRSEIARNNFIDELRECGIKTLIIDTFAKIFPGNANDNSEVNRFLANLDATCDTAGVEQLIMLVHAGNDAKKIRGATALNDHPDSIWYLICDEEGNRFFSAIGRDVNVSEGLLSLDKTTHQITFLESSRKAAKATSQAQLVTEFVAKNPGCKASQIDEVLKGSKIHKASLRSRMVRDGLLVIKKGPRNSDLYFSPQVGFAV